MFQAPLDVILSQRDVVEPDLIIVANAGQISRRAIEGAPLMAIEILSPTSVDMDRRRKPRRFAAFQVPHYWIVDLDAQTIECYRVGGESYELLTRAARGPDVSLARNRGPSDHSVPYDTNLDV